MNGSGVLVKVPRGKGLFVDIFRVAIGAVTARKVRSGLLDQEQDNIQTV